MAIPYSDPAMGPYLGNAGTFLVETLIGLYLLLVMLRFLFQLVQADFYNPISQFLIKASDPPLNALRRVIPRWGDMDMPCVVLLLLLQVAEVGIVSILLGHWPNPVGLLVLSGAYLLRLVIHILVFSIIVQVVMSWLNPKVYNPVIGLLYNLTEPLLDPARKRIPVVSGMDLSPLAVLIGLQLVLILFIAPITDLGRSLM